RPAGTKVRGGEANTGLLGHGLPIGVGDAIAAKIDGSPRRVFVLTGDGELQEGSNWEALMAAAQFKLDNLVVVADRNPLQQGATTPDTTDPPPLDEKA
ncbi:Transketolase, partial [human gut metagenome]